MQKLECGILVVSFGTSYADTRKKTIEAIENRIQEAYPEALAAERRDQRYDYTEAEKQRSLPCGYGKRGSRKDRRIRESEKLFVQAYPCDKWD